MSPEQEHPRRARLLRSTPIRIVIALLFVGVPTTLVQLAAQALGADDVMVALPFAVVAIASYVAYVRLFEKRNAVELALPGAAVQAGAGFLLGALLFSATILALWLLGVASVGSGAGWGAALYALIGAVATALGEEILVRGVLFRILSERLGDLVALLVSAALFGLAHAFNPGATAVSSIAIALEAGVLLAAAFMVTRRLWMPIGLHAAWNFTEGGVFGASVSGHEGHGLLSTQLTGSDLLSGGRFGPEASVVAVAICLTAAGALLALARRRSRAV